MLDYFNSEEIASFTTKALPTIAGTWMYYRLTITLPPKAKYFEFRVHGGSIPAYVDECYVGQPEKVPYVVDVNAEDPGMDTLIVVNF